MITVIENARLLDCVGDEPMENATIVIEDGIIKEISTGKKTVSSDATTINVRGMSVLPGLMDAHVHPAFTENPNFVRRADSPPIYAVLSMVRFMEHALQSGYTTFRCAAWTHWSLKQAVEEGLIKGPRLQIACAPLTSTGGHFDRSFYGEILFHKDRERLYKFPRLCDGPEECLKAAREQFRNGADHIKINATGACDAPTNQPQYLPFNEAEIRAIVSECDARQSYVMAHCEHDDGTKLAVDCGVRTIEHGCFISEGTANLMKEKDVYLVPTNFVFWYIVDKYKDSGRAKWAQVKLLQPLGPGHGTILDGQMRAVEIAKKAGVSIGSGTDFPTFLMDRFEPGFEFKLKTECGFTPYEAIKSGTIVNAEVCRIEEKTGSIEAGKWADVIAVDGNPDEDIELLAKPESVKLVLKEGEMCKNTL